jgi:hypothetical protein
MEDDMQFETQNTIVRDHAIGILDGFFNDLAIGVLGKPTSEDDLKEMYITYVAKTSSNRNNLISQLEGC